MKCLTKLVEHADCEEDSTFFSIPLSIDADTCDVYNVVRLIFLHFLCDHPNMLQKLGILYKNTTESPVVVG